MNSLLIGSYIGRATIGMLPSPALLAAAITRLPVAITTLTLRRASSSARPGSRSSVASAPRLKGDILSLNPAEFTQPALDIFGAGGIVGVGHRVEEKEPYGRHHR